jgi:hypothetical protein
LKKKFIIDTTAPLGSVPGQGGNPLTQFLLNQQTEQNLLKQSEKNSILYNA